MKGIVLGLNPSARLVDLSRQIPPQNIRHAAFFLAAALPYFPPGTLHLIVVDPGVGTERALLYVEVLGQRLLAPDNGCWTLLAQQASDDPLVIRLTEPRYWRPTVSATFHGRDILAPVAGHLSLGLSPSLLGPRVRDWVRLEMAAPVREGDAIMGEVIFVDHFGNLITNISADILDRGAVSSQVQIGVTIVSRWVRSYGEAAAGTLIALISSAGLLEVAVTNGSAAQTLCAGVGDRVRVGREEGDRTCSPSL
jgi:S-adenosylmethionine hydrolase